MLRSVFPKAHQKYFSLPLLGPILVYLVASLLLRNGIGHFVMAGWVVGWFMGRSRNCAAGPGSGAGRSGGTYGDGGAGGDGARLAAVGQRGTSGRRTGGGHPVPIDLGGAGRARVRVVTRGEVPLWTAWRPLLPRRPRGGVRVWQAIGNQVAAGSPVTRPHGPP